MAAKLSVASVAPSRSRGCAGASPRARLSGMRGARSMITRTRGRLRRKINRQDHACMSQPPTTGPIAAKTVIHADQVPMARPRSCSGKDAERMESALRDQQRGSDTLDSAGGDELTQRIRGSAPRGGDSKQRHSYYKCAAPSVAVPDCAPKQQQAPPQTERSFAPPIESLPK